MIQTGKLPETGMMIIESATGDWKNDIIQNPKDFPVTALILDGEKKKRIKLIFETVHMPGSFVFLEVKGAQSFDHPIFQTTDVNKGMARIFRFMNNLTSQNVWIIFAHIDSAAKNEMMILHFESINLTIYTQRRVNESKESFLPVGEAQQN